MLDSPGGMSRLAVVDGERIHCGCAIRRHDLHRVDFIAQVIDGGRGKGSFWISGDDGAYCRIINQHRSTLLLGLNKSYSSPRQRRNQYCSASSCIISQYDSGNGSC